MSPLLFGFLLLHLSNCGSSKQFGLEDAIKDGPEETMYKSKKLNSIEEKEEEYKVERMNISCKMELENLRQQLEEMKVQFGNGKNGNKEVADLKSQVEENETKLDEMIKNQSQDVAKSLKSEMKMECKAEVKKEVDKVLPGAVEQGIMGPALRDGLRL